MSIYRSPGVYHKEVDESLSVKGVSTSVVGMVGTASRGLLETPVLVTSWPQFQEKFGGLIASSYMPHAAKSFFDEGGSILYVVRIAGDGAATSTISLDDGETTPVDAIKVDAISPGVWGNSLKAEAANVVVADSSYDFLVLDANDNVLERYVGVSNDSDDARFIEYIVNPSSRYVEVTVLDETLPPDEAVEILAGGNDGAAVADADYVGDAATHTGIHALDTLDTVKVISAPGVSTEAVHTKLLSYAESRGTLFAVLGSSQGDSPTNIIAHRATIAGGYGALYWPWGTILDPSTSQVIQVPPEGHVLGIIARSDMMAAVWEAPAGLNRGRLRTALGVEYDSTRGERDELYDKQVNTLATFPGKGTVVWGQKVLLSKPSALDRVNVRRLLNFIKESVQFTSKYLVFEPNDERTWRAFIRYMEPFLSNIRQRRGLYDFRVVCDSTTNTPYYIDNNVMVGKIFIKPTRTAEFLELQYIVTGAGANFDEL